ncbi:MAG: hypothetical protein KC443_11875, partial [Anaerolineales bacterium]|nr:hypothetical protein [Anaerolineales bacterium]
AQSAVGPLFFGFIAIMFIFSAYWLNRRRADLASKNSLQSFLSREAAFLYNNFLILAILAVVFLFTNYPIISELFTGERGFVGPPVYEQALGPLFAVLVLLMGVAPLTMWFRGSVQRLGKAMLWPAVLATVAIVVMIVLGIHLWAALVGFWVVIFSMVLTILEFVKGTHARMKRGENVFVAFSNLMARNRRRYGGYWIHIGVLIMAVGVIGVELFQEETQQQLQVGDTISLGRYEMQFLGVEQRPGADDLIITEATVDVYENGRFVKTLTPRREIYTRTGQPMTIPNARSTILEDFYVLLAEQPTSPDSAIIRVFLNPLINWVWAGGFVFIFGTLIAAWPDAVEDKITAVQARRRPAVVTTGD